MDRGPADAERVPPNVMRASVPSSVPQGNEMGRYSDWSLNRKRLQVSKLGSIVLYTLGYVVCVKTPRATTYQACCLAVLNTRIRRKPRPNLPPCDKKGWQVGVSA